MQEQELRLGLGASLGWLQSGKSRNIRLLLLFFVPKGWKRERERKRERQGGFTDLGSLLFLAATTGPGVYYSRSTMLNTAYHEQSIQINE